MDTTLAAQITNHVALTEFARGHDAGMQEGVLTVSVILLAGIGLGYALKHLSQLVSDDESRPVTPQRASLTSRDLPPEFVSYL